MKEECNIVRDLLPLYLENMVSDQTGDFIKKHLDDCPNCTAEWETMKSGSQINTTNTEQRKDEAKPLMTLKKNLRKKSVLAAAFFAAFLILVMILLSIFPVYRLTKMQWASDFYKKSEVALLLHVGSPTDRAEAQAVLRLADAAFHDCRHTREENQELYGLLSRYATDVSRGASFVTHSLELLSAHLGETNGSLWVNYTKQAFDQNGDKISGSSNVYSLWNVEKDDSGAWVVTEIREHP